MARVVVVLACFLVPFVRSGVASAQDAQSSQPHDPILARIKVDRGGGFHVTPLFSVVFGDIKEGSSAAAGPAVSHDFADGAFAQLKGVYSLRNFKLLQARYDSRPLLSRRAAFSTRLRWQDAPELSLYAIGAGSPRARAEYGERKMEWSGVFSMAVTPHLTLTAGSGFERYWVDAGFVDTDEDERLDAVPDAPGLASRPSFVHSHASAWYTTRLSPDYGRTGTTLTFDVDAYHDLDGPASFRTFEIGAGRLFPMFRVATSGAPDWRGALDISGRAWLTQADDTNVVPFFLMPMLGGGDHLLGYPSYRFRDRDALALAAEYRWAVHPMVDIAALYEAGTVAPTIRGLGRHALARSAGGGLRLHSKTSALMRVDLTRSREGLQFTIGFNIGS